MVRERPQTDLQDPARLKQRPYRARLSVQERAMDDAIIAEGLHIKPDDVLPTMRDSHAAKIPHAQLMHDRAFLRPDAIRQEVLERGGTSDEADEAVASEQALWGWKLPKLQAIVAECDAEIANRAVPGKVEREPIR